MRPYLYNNGDGKWIHCALLSCLRNRDRPKSKQFAEVLVRRVRKVMVSCAQALGDDAFSYKFEDSELVDNYIGSDTMESHPERWTEHCWNVENRYRRERRSKSRN